MRTLKLIACFAAVAIATGADATTINFDTLPGGGSVPDGTIISNQYASQGVTFSGVDAGQTVYPGATAYSGGTENAYHTGNYLGNAVRAELFITDPSFQLTPRFDILRITFTSPANNITLGLNNFSLVGTTTFNAYDAMGNLLQTFTTNQGTGWAPRSLSVNGVARLDLLNNIFNGSETYFGIDQLSFDAPTAAVPEPASWGMLLLGLGMVGGVMRHRARVSRVTFA